MRLLTRQGYLIEEQGMTYLAEADTDRALAPLQAASCTYRIALGPRAGQKVLSLQSLPSQARPSSQELRVKAHGFSLHAAVRWRADQRKELEHLCRYITRPAIANERLKRNRANRVVLQLKSPYKDGTTHVVMSPMEFIQTPCGLHAWRECRPDCCSTPPGRKTAPAPPPAVLEIEPLFSSSAAFLSLAFPALHRSSSGTSVSIPAFSSSASTPGLAISP
jgi:hypothetical protein